MPIAKRTQISIRNRVFLHLIATGQVAHFSNIRSRKIRFTPQTSGY